MPLVTFVIGSTQSLVGLALVPIAFAINYYIYVLVYDMHVVMLAFAKKAICSKPGTTYYTSRLNSANPSTRHHDGYSG